MMYARQPLILILIAALCGCATTSVVVDKNAMATHLTFLGARVAAADAPLEAAAKAALEAGDYEACIGLADELLISRHRVPWHEATGLWTLRVLDAEDPGPAPDVPASNTVCGPKQVEDGPLLAPAVEPTGPGADSP